MSPSASSIRDPTYNLLNTTAMPLHVDIRGPLGNLGCQVFSTVLCCHHHHLPSHERSGTNNVYLHIGYKYCTVRDGNERIWR